MVTPICQINQGGGALSYAPSYKGTNPFTNLILMTPSKLTYLLKTPLLWNCVPETSIICKPVSHQ